MHIKLLGDLPVGLGGARGGAAGGPLPGASTSGKASRTSACRRAAPLRGRAGLPAGAIYCYGRSAEDVIAQAARVHGRAPRASGTRREQEGWRGPPACWVCLGRLKICAQARARGSRRPVLRRACRSRSPTRDVLARWRLLAAAAARRAAAQARQTGVNRRRRSGCSRAGRGDDDVVEDGGDDRVLAG